MNYWAGPLLLRRQRNTQRISEKRARVLVARAFSLLREGQRVGYLSQTLADGSRVHVQAERGPDGRIQTGKAAVRITHRWYVEGASLQSYEPLWLPEGFVITPRTSFAPDGYGLPRLEPDGTPIRFGTRGGPLREMLLNKFERNFLFEGKLNRKELSHYKPLAYTLVEEGNFDRPAFSDERGAILGYQFSEQFALAAGWPEEGDSGSWHAHRATEQPFDNAVLAEILRLTNEQRTLAGRDPVFPPLESDANPARMVVEENRLAGYMGHDNDQHRDGYERFSDRGYKDGVVDGTGENLGLEFGHTNLTPEELAALWVGGWVDSPEHYANMVSEDWDSEEAAEDDNGQAGFMHAHWAPGEIKGETSEPPDEPVDYPTSISGRLASQVFTARTRWLYFGNYYWEGEEGTLSWSMAYATPETNQYASYDWRLAGGPEIDANERGFVYLAGRRYETHPGMRCFGAALVKENSRLYIITAVLNRLAGALEFRRKLVSELQRNEYDTGDPVGWDLVTSVSLNGKVRLSLVRFSQDGRRAVWRTERLGAVADQCLPIGFSTTDQPDLRQLVTYPASLVPRTPNVAEFWEWFGGQVQLVETVGGVQPTITVGENDFLLEASGECTVAMDYVSDELERVTAVIDDRYFVQRAVPSVQGEKREMRMDRKLKFPSGKEFQYAKINTDRYITNEPAQILSVDWLDVGREDVAGARLAWESDWDNGVVSCVDATYELFANDTVLDVFNDTSGNLFAKVAPGVIYNGRQIDAWRPPHPNAYTTADAFIPFPFHGSQVTSGSTLLSDLRYVCAEPVVDYSQGIVGGSEGSITLLYGGVGVYNPLPFFGSLSDAWVLHYFGEQVFGAYSRGVDLTTAPVGQIARKQILGHDATIDLDNATNLTITDDIFPIGLI